MLALRARSPCLFARGRCPLCTPFVGAQLPKQVARLGFYPQSGGRSAPPTPGDFLPDEKVTKESPRGGHPLWVLPLGGIIIPPAARRCAALPLPPERSATPGSTQYTNYLPRHGLTAEGVTLGIAWEKIKTDLPTNPKWQIGLFLLLKAARVQASAQHQ